MATLFKRRGFGQKLETTIVNREWTIEVEREAGQLQGYATKTTGQTYDMALDQKSNGYVSSEACRVLVPFKVRAALHAMLMKYAAKHKEKK